MDRTKVQVCSICHEEYVGWGNNAEPITDGLCCDKCDREVVDPIRWTRIKALLKRDGLLR